MQFVSVDEFEKNNAELEERLRLFAMKNVIEMFEYKSWALYEAQGEITNFYDLEKTVENGYENVELKPNQRYVPLPHVKNYEGDYNTVMEAIKNLKQPPFFIELDKNSIPEEYKEIPTPQLLDYNIIPKVNAVYPIDSIELNTELALVIDKRGLDQQSSSRIPGYIKEPAIIIGYHEIQDKLQYQINPCRSIMDEAKKYPTQ